MSTTRSRVLQVDALGLAVCAALAVGAYFVGVEPVINGYALVEEKARLVKEQTQNAADAEEFVRIEQARLAALRQQFDATNVRLSPSTDLNKRLDVITALVEKHGLKVHGIDPGTASSDPRIGKFVMVPIRLAGAGSFAGVSAFLHELLADRFPDVEVRTLSLSSTPAEKPAADGPGTTASFAIEMRWYAEPAASAGVVTSP